uniref:Complementary sex determination N-terminal domain-containing protein n=1 Tax=Fopius arisanus TaxID=64838 RepID=A0A0C9RXS6_9HYME
MRRRDDKSRDSRSSLDHVPEDRLRELERRRKEWRIEQEKQREHERRKMKMIEEYEARRARELEAKKQRRRSKSRSRSGSPSTSRRRRSRSRETSRSRLTSSRVPVMSEKCDSSSTSNAPLFKGREGSKISVSELKTIKVNIHRNIPNAEETTELLRDITNPDEIALKRREGEGSKPIFEREEIIANEICTHDIPERRTIVMDESHTDERRKSKQRSRSQSSERSKHRSPSRLSSCTNERKSKKTWIFILMFY